MSQLDAVALEELGRRAESLVEEGLEFADAGTAGAATVPALERKFRLFASLLQATRDNLAALQRAEAQHSPRWQGPGAGNTLPLNGYGPAAGMLPPGLFEDFGHYAREQAIDSIWAHGGMMQPRVRRDPPTRKLNGQDKTARA